MTTAPTTIITGATSGIGLELARLYQRAGHRLVLVGRRPRAELDPMLFTPSNYCCTDLTTENAVVFLMDFLHMRGIEEIQLLVHAAGAGFVGEIPNQSMENIISTLAINLRAPIHLTRVLLAGLHRGRGKVVFIGSVVACLPCPDYAVYAASKTALAELARSLRAETANRVAVQVIHPGATRTPFHERAGLDRAVVDWQRFPPADGVARAIAQAISGSKSTAVIGMGNRVLWNIARWFPYFFDRWRARRAQSLL